MTIKQPIPITVFTGFLGSGKTTIINELIKSNPEIKFGLIINEFGEVGIDGQIIDNPQDEIVEMSDGCMCCIVRSDLIEAVEKMLSTTKIDYLIIETSGLAEPVPILQTFMSLNTELCTMDALVTIVDSINYNEMSKSYNTINDQIKYADLVVVNKANHEDSNSITILQAKLSKINEQCSFFVNDGNNPLKLLIDTGKYNIDKIVALSEDVVELEEEHNHDTCTNPDHNHSKEHNHNHDHHDHHDHNDHHEHHHHEHNEVDEFVWKTDKAVNPHKMDNWIKNNFPANAIRSKGILQIDTGSGIKAYVFQMVGANKSLVPLDTLTSKIVTTSCLVFIGKGLDRDQIIKDLQNVSD